MRTIRRLLLVALFTILGSPAFSQESEAETPKFESDAAKAAMTRFQERLDFLDDKLSEQIEITREELRTELSEALATAVKNEEFAEVQRISAFLNSKITTGNERQENGDSREISKLKNQVSELQRELNLAKKQIPEYDAFYESVAGSTYRVTFTHGSGRTSDITFDRDGSTNGGREGFRWAVIGPNLLVWFNPTNRHVDMMKLSEDGTKGEVFGVGVLNPSKANPSVLLKRGGTGGRTKR